MAVQDLGRRRNASRVSEVFFTKSPSQAALDALEESRPQGARVERSENGGHNGGKRWKHGGKRWGKVGDDLGKIEEQVAKSGENAGKCWKDVGKTREARSIWVTHWEKREGKKWVSPREYMDGHGNQGQL